MAYYKKALYSRIYNKIKFDPVEKFAFVVTLCVVTLFSFFSCVKCYAVEEEELSFTRVTNIQISPNSNIFTSSSTTLGYLLMEPDYIYTVTLPESFSIRYFAVSDDVPVVDGTYQLVGNATGGEQFIYRCTSSEYLYLDYGVYNSSITVTRRKAGGQNVAVSDLVDNVGINQIWGVFENGISFVSVVVLVAFGLFLVVLAIKKVSKGKSEF